MGSQNNEKKHLMAFLKKHHVLSLSTHSDDGLWVAPLYYCFSKEPLSFVCVTSKTSRHFRQMLAVPDVAFSVFEETRNVLKIQGIQCEARALLNENQKDLSKLFFKEFDFALKWFVPDKYQFIKLIPKTIKYTDNTQGFGFKSIFKF
jgi:uncharacterized protein YhbP (UPF0306 family)